MNEEHFLLKIFPPKKSMKEEPKKGQRWNKEHSGFAASPVFLPIPPQSWEKEI
jgi:hypothetical protein